MDKPSQTQQVITALRQNGGYATFAQLNQLVDVSQWKTKTPYASIRRIVQQCHEIFKIRPGLWALTENRATVLAKLGLNPGDKKSETMFSHAYYQGIIAVIGRHQGFQTYVPPQDKNRRAIADTLLKDLAMTTRIPPFSYPGITKRAATVDVVWLNDRGMPDSFFEVEHTTDIKNSLVKFMDLRDFFARFIIVADKSRKLQFDDVLNRSAFAELLKDKRVQFIPYDKIDGQYTSLSMQVI